jgi:membrane-associated phospholipid phosphatase
VRRHLRRSFIFRSEDAINIGYKVPLILTLFLALNFSLCTQVYDNTVQFQIKRLSEGDNQNRFYSNGNVSIYEYNKYNDTLNADVKLFRKINNSRSKFKDSFFNIFDRSMLPMMIILPAFTFTYGRSAEKTFDENTGYLLGVSVVTNLVVTASLKYTIKRKRPRNILNNVYTRNEHSDKYSFPSGHSSSSFAQAGMFLLRYPDYPQVYLPMYGWAIAIAYARPYFGMHYPSDLLAGALIGTGSSLLIYSLRSERVKKRCRFY